MKIGVKAMCLNNHLNNICFRFHKSIPTISSLLLPWDCPLTSTQLSVLFPRQEICFYLSYPTLILSLNFGGQTYDAAVGDITILAKRSENVDFTQPYIESGLSMIVVAEAEGGKAWIFLKPFTPTMWMATGAVLICTMLTVWFLERLVNPEFRGPWTDQLATALWFTFSSLFFAHSKSPYLKPLFLPTW